MPNMKSKYIKIAELLNIALFVRVSELLLRKRYVPNVKLKYFNIAEVLESARILRVTTAIITNNICAKCEVKIR